jgi:DNA-binding response OmpR family regulator
MSLILLIDDDVSLHQLLSQYLEQQGHTIIHASDGREGLHQLFDNRPNLIVLDVMMPNLDGWATLERIREMSPTPVILLTAKDTEGDKLRGFQLGSDDYVTKPFSFAELSARIDAVLKRSIGYGIQQGILQVGGLVVDPVRHLVTRDGQPIELTPTEFKLLEVFMRAPGQVFTQEQLVSRVWGAEYADEVGYIRRYIWHLRQKIEPEPNEPTYIHNERGIGYKLDA